MQSHETVRNTGLVYPISNITRLHLTCQCPIFNPNTIAWLLEVGIDLEEVIIQIFLALTPEGIEEEYFGVFDRYIKANKLGFNDPNYIKAREASEELLNAAIAQYVYSPAFEYVIRGDVVDINVDRDIVILTVEYEER